MKANFWRRKFLSPPTLSFTINFYHVCNYSKHKKKLLSQNEGKNFKKKFMYYNKCTLKMSLLFIKTNTFVGLLKMGDLFVCILKKWKE